jgi:hypothetical protein
MPLIIRGKANIKYLSIVGLLAIVAGVIIYWQYSLLGKQYFSLEYEAIKELSSGSKCSQEAQTCSNGSSDCKNLNCPMVNVSCKENSKYFLIAKENDTLGSSDFLVKKKTNKDQIIPCGYTIKKTDFELENQAATYFLALTDNFLILDSGTGPFPRGLTAYNLNSRQKVYVDNYSAGTDMNSDRITVINDVIKYWSPTNKEVNKENCPKLSEYSSEGLGAEIEAYVSLDLSTLVKKELGEYRCSPTQ